MTQKHQGFPDLILGLPEIAVPIEGVRGWLLQGENNQLVFFILDPVAKIPKHSHGAQWGIVIDGEMELTIDGDTETYRKGDSYFIPEGVVHSAVFREKTYAIDFFADKERYSI